MRSQTIHHATYAFVTANMRATVPLMMDFVATTFPQFGRFPNEDKTALFRFFARSMARFEKALYTTKYLPESSTMR